MSAVTLRGCPRCGSYAMHKQMSIEICSWSPVPGDVSAYRSEWKGTATCMDCGFVTQKAVNSKILPESLRTADGLETFFEEELLIEGNRFLNSLWKGAPNK